MKVRSKDSIHGVDCSFCGLRLEVAKKKNLNFVDVPPPCSGLAVYDVLYECLQEWGIEWKVSIIIVDNAAYNDLTVKRLQDSLFFFIKAFL